MAYVGNQGGIIFFSTASPKPVVYSDEHPDGQFWLWSPLMIFSLVMACVVGLILIILLLYFLFYYCVYGTCPGCVGCWWCPQAAPAEETVKVHMRRPSRSDSCRSSVRSRSSSVCSHRSHGDGRLVRVNSCSSLNESMVGVQPMIIQTIPAIQAPPQIYQQPIIQAPAPLPPPAPPASNFGGELKIVIGESRPAPSTRSDNVIVYDMARSNGSGVTLGGGGGGISLGGGRREYEMTSVDDFGGTYRGGAFNGGFDRDDGGSFLSEGHRSAIIDIGKGGGNFYPSLPHYDD